MAGKHHRDSNRQLRILAQSAVLEEATTPYLIRTSMLIISLTFILFLVWASITKFKEVSQTVGEIVPTRYVQTLQHLEGGIVSQILVHDDDLVRKGQVLIRLKGEKILADYERIKTRQVLLRLKAERLRAFGHDRKARFTVLAAGHPELVKRELRALAAMREKRARQENVLQEQIRQKQAQVKIFERSKKTVAANLKIALAGFKTQKELYHDRLISETEFLAGLKEKNERQGALDTANIKIGQAKESIREYQWRLQSMVSTSRDAALRELDNVEDEVSGNVKMLEKIEKQAQRLKIHSPVDGIVKGLAIHTVGGVIAPGTKIMDIVPTDNELIAEVRISPSDIGHVKIGYPAIVKVTSYDFSRYGALDGTVSGISATTFSGKRGTVYYKGNIRLKKNYLGNISGRNIVIPGMIVHADIITGEKRLIAYLLKPIHASLSSAFRER